MTVLCGSAQSQAQPTKVTLLSNVRIRTDNWQASEQTNRYAQKNRHKNARQRALIATYVYLAIKHKQII